MIILAEDDGRYLVKTNSADDKCYLVDTRAEIVFGYDLPDKFLRFGDWEEYKYNEKVEDKIINLLRNKI